MTNEPKGPHGEQMPPAITYHLEGIGIMSQHISVMLADLYTALDEGRPWSLVRMGDGEVHALTGVHAPWTYYANACATLADAGDLRQRSIDAVRNADWAGWLEDQWLSRALEAAQLLPKGWTEWHFGILEQLKRRPTEEERIAAFPEEPQLIQRAQFGWCNLHMGIRRGFVERVLRQESLFLAGEPMQRWYDQVLLPAGLGTGAIVWQGKTTVSTTEEAFAIADAFVASSATVMLASLGVWALPIVGRAKQLGKIALDWGHAPDHHLRFEEPHWQYRLNTCCEDSPAGTMAHYKHAGSAGQCLPELGF